MDTTWIKKCDLFIEIRSPISLVKEKWNDTTQESHNDVTPVSWNDNPFVLSLRISAQATAMYTTLYCNLWKKESKSDGAVSIYRPTGFVCPFVV